MAKQKRKNSGYSWALLALGFLAGAVFVFALLRYGGFEIETSRPKPKPAARVAPPPAPPPPEEVKPPAVEETPGEPAAPAVIEVPRPSAKLAIVIDDMGTDMKKLRELVSLGSPVTIAVMPNMRFSRETSMEASAKGLEVIMHMPMEPKDVSDNNPGTDALLTAMTAEEIKALMEAGFKTVPDAIGINNHMGSKFTEDAVHMQAVLQLIKKKNMFFLDSRTSANSVGARLAREIGVRNADRNVFLDNNRDVKYIKGQIAEAVKIARKRGKAIAIGHPYPETIQALKESVPGLDDTGIEVVRISEIIGKGSR